VLNKGTTGTLFFGIIEGIEARSQLLYKINLSGQLTFSYMQLSLSNKTEKTDV